MKFLILVLSQSIWKKKICLSLKGNYGKIVADYQILTELVSILTAKYQVKKNKTGLTALFSWIIYLLSRYFQRRVIFILLVCVGGLED